MCIPKPTEGESSIYEKPHPRRAAGAGPRRAAVPAGRRRRPHRRGQNRFLRRTGPGRGPAEGPSLRGGPGRRYDPGDGRRRHDRQTRADLQREIERQTGPKGIDLSWWQSHYNDIIGYVYSPGTPISYPIAYDGNNEYYLHHDLYGNYSEYGTIFLDARVPSDFSGHNNVLYGHHMSDGTMFASISNYKQQWYYDAHPYFFLYTNAGKYRVDLFAGIVVPGTHEVFSTSLSADQLQRFINNSTFYSGKGVPSGQIVTLCTCSYEAANYRYVVLGELVKLEDTPADTATEAAA